MGGQPVSLQPALDNSAYLSEDTIYALSTGLGGALNLVRLSGPTCREVLKKLCKEENPTPNLVGLVDLVHGGERIDQAMVVFFEGPRSFTGEDVLEFSLHGSSWIVEKLFAALETLGVRQALPGEFSFRAVRNGKMNLAQAQAVAEVVGAKNEEALKLAFEKFEGSQQRLLKELAEELRGCAASGELGLDFSDEDVPELALEQLQTRLKKLLPKLEHLRDSFERGQRLQEGVTLALVGRPNAGKSSLFNVLLGQDRSIVTDIAGTTRDVVSESLTLRDEGKSLSFRVLDTAGLRHKGDRVERLGIERSQEAAHNADLVLWLVGPETTQSELAEDAQAWGLDPKRAVMVFSKSDLGQPRVEVSGVSVSALNQDGVSELVREVMARGLSQVGRDQGEVLLTSQDQKRCVTQACEHLERALGCTELELYSADLRQALTMLGPLIGETLPDDLLGQIFSNFCIGK